MIAIRYYAVCLLVFSLLPFFLPAQVIEGKIRSVEGHIPDVATIFLKSESIPPQILANQTTTTGDFRISIPQEFKTLIIEIIAYPYKPLTQRIAIGNDIEVYKFEFALEEAPPIILEGVIFAEKRTAITSRNDTTTFIIKNFIDGTEQKVQDILKKLPGFEVNEQTGEIKFKGKSIERVLLDGNDLFGLNYVIPTKNINAKIINEVEVIENYNNNPLLKQFEHSNRIAVNLKIEDSSFDISGNINIGSGLKSPGDITRRLNGDILGIGDKQKSFSTIQHNNIGLNNTPFDFLTFSQNVDDRIDQDFFFKKIIPDRIITTEIDPERINVNNQTFFSTNQLFSWSEHSGLRINANYYVDRIFFGEKYSIENNFDSLRFITSDRFTISRKPQHLRGELDYRNLLSKNLYISCKAKVFTEKIHSVNLINRNNEDNFSSSLITREAFIGSNLSVSHKLNRNNIIHANLNLAHHIPDQSLIIYPSILGPNNFNDQQIKALENNLFFELRWLSGKKERNTELTSGYQRTFIKLSSIHDTLPNNQVMFFSHQLFQSFAYTLIKDRWVLIPKINFKLIEQQITEEPFDVSQKKFFIPESTVLFYIKMNNENTLKSAIGIKYESLTESHLFSNPIMITNRILINNIPTPLFQKVSFIDLSFLQNNLSRKYQWLTRIRYERFSDFFAQKLQINELFTYTTSQPVLQSWSVINSDSYISSFLSVLQSTVRINLNYSLIKYFNFVNLSDLRENTNQIISPEVFIKSAFDMPVNIENSFSQVFNISYSRNQDLKFSNTSVKNTFSVYFKPKENSKWYVRLKNETLIPDINHSRQRLNFLDLFVLITPPQKKWSLMLEFRNLTNTKEFRTIHPTDFSVNTIRTSVFPRLALASFTYYF